MDEAIRWNEAFDFAAAELKDLAECLRRNGGSTAAARDEGDLEIWSYEENVGDTLVEAGVTSADWNPVFVERAWDAYFAEVK